MNRIVLPILSAIVFSMGVQAQESISSVDDSCKIEKQDSCSSMKHCPFCRDAEREMKLAKVKGMGRTLPLPLDSTRCDKCRKMTPNRGTQKIKHEM